MLTTTRLPAVAVVALLIAGAVSACGGEPRSNSAVATNPAAERSTAMTIDPILQQHRYRKCESFDYLYENSEAGYATEQVRGGGLPRVTNLTGIDEVRANVRVSTVAKGGGLLKKVTFLNARSRKLTPGDLDTSDPVKFLPLSAVIPDFPAEISHTYKLGSDGDVARHLDVVFGDHMDPLLYKFVDVFTWPSIIENIPENLAIGHGTVSPAVDVSLFGLQFHNHNRILLFDRVDLLDGWKQAYFKVQVPGNHLDAVGMDTNYQMTFHVPLEGPAKGLVSTGELQETVFGGGQAGQPFTATIRQLSMTLQTKRTRSEVTVAPPSIGKSDRCKP